MHKLAPLALGLVALLVCQPPALARGRGVQSYLVTSDGKLAAALGETRSELLDPAAFVRYRYHEGRITATPLDKPSEVLWSAPAKPQMQGRAPLWRLLPDVLVVIGEDSLTGIDRASGKALYTTAAEGFTRNPYFLKYAGETDTPPVPTLYLIDDSAPQAQEKPAAPGRLAKFDLTKGRFLWKSDIVTAAGKKFRPCELDARGIVRGPDEGEDYFFDPATGKALDKAPFTDKPPELDPPQPEIVATCNKIECRNTAGKTLWSREQLGSKGTALLTADLAVLPLVTERSQTQLLALERKDGAERWRCDLPLGFFVDQVTVEIHAAKSGYLVQVEWLVLD